MSCIFCYDECGAECRREENNLFEVKLVTRLSGSVHIHPHIKSIAVCTRAQSIVTISAVHNQ